MPLANVDHPMTVIDDHSVLSTDLSSDSKEEDCKPSPSTVIPTGQKNDLYMLVSTSSESPGPNTTTNNTANVSDSNQKAQHAGIPKPNLIIDAQSNNNTGSTCSITVRDESTTAASLYESDHEWRRLRIDRSRRQCNLHLSHAEWLVRHTVTAQGLTALHLAVVYNRLEIAQLLVQAGVDVNARYVH